MEHKDVRVTVGPKTGITYVRDPARCSKIKGNNSQCKNPPAPGAKSCQYHLDYGRQRAQLQRKTLLDEAGKIRGHPKKNLVKTNIHEEQQHISKKQFMAEDPEGEDEDVDSKSKKKRKILAERLPSKSGNQKSKNGYLIERKLFKTKAACDAIYRLNLETNQLPAPKSWIEHKKMQSFDDKSMSGQKWMAMYKASTMTGRAKLPQTK